MPDYHGWTHRPKEQGGTDPIPVASSTDPWILLLANGQTLPGDNGFDPLLFDELIWDPALVTLNSADPTDSSDPYFGIDVDTFGGTDYFTFTPRVEGFFNYQIEAVTDQGTGGANHYFQLRMTPSTTSGMYLFMRQIGFHADWSNAGMSWMENWDKVHVNRTLIHSDQQPLMVPQCRQNTGSDKGLGGSMLVTYEAARGGGAKSTWEDVSP